MTSSVLLLNHQSSSSRRWMRSVWNATPTASLVCFEGWRETLNNSLGDHIHKVEDLSDVNPSATLGNVARVRIVKWLCFKKLNEEKKLRSPSDLQPGEAGCRPGGQIFTAWIEDTGLKQWFRINLLQWHRRNSTIQITTPPPHSCLTSTRMHIKSAEPITLNTQTKKY